MGFMLQRFLGTALTLALECCLLESYLWVPQASTQGVPVT